uniref:Salivary lipocalin n=1 Tax=Ixodes ricinus TaxID=34613 RepID=V5H080_IXORI
MFSTHLVFASLVATIAGDNFQSQRPVPLQHVDAWRTVTQKEAFYLMYRSYEFDAGVGGTGICVSLQLCDKNDTTRTATTRVMYRDAPMVELRGFTVRTTMARSWNSTVDDIVRHGDADNCSAPAHATTVEYRFVYSDYSTCDVVVVFGTLEPKCELWVKDGYQKHVGGTFLAIFPPTNDVKGNITRCEREYERLCHVKYQIYDKNICSSPPKWPQKDLQLTIGEK